jgi:hypothetical protein
MLRKLVLVINQIKIHIDVGLKRIHRYPAHYPYRDNTEAPGGFRCASLWLSTHLSNGEYQPQSDSLVAGQGIPLRYYSFFGSMRAPASVRRFSSM